MKKLSNATIRSTSRICSSRDRARKSRHYTLMTIYNLLENPLIRTVCITKHPFRNVCIVVMPFPVFQSAEIMYMYLVDCMVLPELEIFAVFFRGIVINIMGEGQTLFV